VVREQAAVFFQEGSTDYTNKVLFRKHSVTLTLMGVPNLIRDEAGEEPSGSSTFAVEESSKDSSPSRGSDEPLEPRRCGITIIGY